MLLANHYRSFSEEKIDMHYKMTLPESCYIITLQQKAIHKL